MKLFWYLNEMLDNSKILLIGHGKWGKIISKYLQKNRFSKIEIIDPIYPSRFAQFVSKLDSGALDEYRCAVTIVVLPTPGPPVNKRFGTLPSETNFRNDSFIWSGRIVSSIFCGRYFSTHNISFAFASIIINHHKHNIIKRAGTGL